MSLLQGTWQKAKGVWGRWGESSGVMRPFEVKALEQWDRAWAAALLREHWGSARIVTRGVVHDGERLPGFLALMEGRRVGLLTYRIEGAECESVNLNSLVEGMGVGSALVEAVRKVATSTGCRRLWLITTNDNMAALRFYQTGGFQLVAVHRNALEESRRLKPEIALVGLDGVPVRDEIELELLL